MKIALDTNIFISALEDKTKVGKQAGDLLEKIKKDALQAYVSVLAVQEFMVKIYENGQDEMVGEYLEFLSGGGLITIVNFERDIALKAAKIRAMSLLDNKLGKLPKIQTPDSIHLATALYAKAKVFYTTEKGLPKRIENMEIKVLS